MESPICFVSTFWLKRLRVQLNELEEPVKMNVDADADDDDDEVKTRRDERRSNYDQN